MSNQFGEIHRDRLLKLAEHLEGGKLGLSSFDFYHYRKQTACGTVGCAIGDCGSVFLEWPKNADWQMAVDFSEKFFCLEKEEFSLLFKPQSCSIHGVLMDNATKKQVAAHIRSFVTKKCQEVGIPERDLSTHARLTQESLGVEALCAKKEAVCTS